MFSNHHQDELLLSYHDSVIRKSDYETLNEGEWFNDAIIGFFFTYLENKYPNPKIGLLQPSMVHLLRQTEDKKALLGVLPNSVFTCQFLFIPINDHIYESSGGSHWSLLVYSKPDNTFYYYDSFRDTNYEHAKHASYSIMKLLDSLPSKLEMKDTPQQQNGNDCGVFLTCFVEYLYVSLNSNSFLNDKPPPFIWDINYDSIYHPNRQRQRIRDFIIELM